MLNNFSKPVKILLITAVIFVVAYVILYVVITRYVTTHNLKNMILSTAQESLQRNITVDDDVKFELGWDLRPHIELHNLVIANADWASQERMLTVAQADLKLNLTSLLHKKLHVMSLDLKDASLNLETMGEQNNWTFTHDDTTSSGMKLIINEVAINTGNLSYYQNHLLSNQLSITNLEVNADADDQEFAIEFDGTFNQIPIKTDFNAVVSKQKFEIEIHNFTSGSSDLTGDLTIDYDEMDIKGNLASKHLSLAEILPHTESSGSGTYSIPDIQFPIDKLKSADFDVNIKIAELVLHKATLQDVTITTSNKKQILTITLNPPAKIVNSKLDASLIYDLNPIIPSMQLKLNTQDLSVAQLITSATGAKSPISGSTLNFNVNLTGAGTNLKDIVASMHGKILATATAGTYYGNTTTSISAFFLNIFTSLLTFEKSKPNTDFSCVVLNFNVNQGIANTKNGLALEATTVKVQGSGTMNFNNGALDLSITPYNNITGPINLSQFTLAQAVSITGTIDNPKVSFNPLGIFSSSVGKVGDTLLKGIAGLGAGISGGVAALATDLLDTKKAASITPCKTALEQ